MENLYLGIDFSDLGCSLSSFNPETRMVQVMPDENGEIWIPSFLSLNEESGQWKIGKEAQEDQGQPGCLVLKNLPSLLRSGKTLELNGECYTAEKLAGEFLNKLLWEAQKRSGTPELVSVAICLENVSAAEAEKLSRICSELELDLQKVHIINRQESFMYYLMSQKREIWSNVSYLFDYGEDGLFCYELDVLKGMRPVTAQAHREKVQDAPPAAVTAEGGEFAEAADQWFCMLADRKLTGRIVSSVVLCGSGFSDLSWAKQFIRRIYTQKSRKVYQVEAFYGMGAAFAAYHLAEEHRYFPYICICEGRISTTISIFVEEKETSEQLILIREGTSCYEARASIDLNLIEQKTLDLYVKNTGAPESYKLPLDLSSLMEDGRERTKVRLSIAFSKEDTMMVRVEDLGFGEIYPATEQVILKSYHV
ncbi:MAG: DUF5716 family protein [Lachnospiraceae bacterium]|nr:DUF5716 family protein [Lachnospiraceae bacterium]